MADNKISANFSATDRLAVMDAIATIRQKLPFLIDLTTEDRRTIVKMGDKSRAFVSKALEVATQNPEFLPRSFNLEEMRQDLALYEALYPILLGLTQLQELVDDTCMAAGSEAYASALAVYGYAKARGDVTGLDAVINEMGRRFTSRSKKKQPENSMN